jgi:glycosyltransferase involved in cell wall biosynthesis
LESVAWSNDVVVVDSFSTDRTPAIATAKGARVIQHEFSDYAAQRNFALNEVKYLNRWVLMIDADERVSTELRADIEQLDDDGGIVLYRIRRKDVCWERWLRRSSGYPTWFGRLIRVGSVEVRRSINEEYIPNGCVGYLGSHLIHYPLQRGVSYWFERHNLYSSMEAELVNEPLGRTGITSELLTDPVKRRKALKRLAYRLPARPVFVFMYLYFCRLGMLDGIPGLRFCIMRTMYEAMIDLKVAELRSRQPVVG